MVLQACFDVGRTVSLPADRHAKLRFPGELFVTWGFASRGQQIHKATLKPQSRIGVHALPVWPPPERFHSEYREEAGRAFNEHPEPSETRHLWSQDSPIPDLWRTETVNKPQSEKKNLPPCRPENIHRDANASISDERTDSRVDFSERSLLIQAEALKRPSVLRTRWDWSSGRV